MMEHPAPQTFEPFFLKDGTPVTIRPIRPDDAPRLQALLSRLSPESIFYRFLEYLKGLTPKQAEELATVDYHRRMALVGTLEEDGEELVIAVARYSLQSESQPDVAEVGVVVEDRFQNQRLGTHLLNLLTSYARQHGIRAFTGIISHQNRRILNFIRSSGLPTQRRLEMGTWEIRVDLG
jgi:acetyltransferase